MSGADPEDLKLSLEQERAALRRLNERIHEGEFYVWLKRSLLLADRIALARLQEKQHGDQEVEDLKLALREAQDNYDRKNKKVIELKNAVKQKEAKIAQWEKGAGKSCKAMRA